MSALGVHWLFTMTRSGSSAVVYASAHALNLAVADEPFGPWDRTGEPYNYPKEQVELHRMHLEKGERLDTETCALAERVLTQIAADQGKDGVIIKLPHAMIEPAEVERFWPEHRMVFLVRNPLARLNSLYTRGWTDTIREPHDLETVRIFLHRFMRTEADKRLTFDEFTQTPRRFFRRLWSAWGVAFDEDQVETAVRYRAQHYHGSSGETIEGHNPHRVLSEHRKEVPREACEAYMADPVVGGVMRRMGWISEDHRYTRSSTA